MKNIQLISEIPTLLVGNDSMERLETTQIPKSNSDSLLTGSSLSLKSNKSPQKSESLKTQTNSSGIQSSSSLAAIPSVHIHNKLQNAANIVFKKSPNSDGSSQKSYSTYNETDYSNDDDNRSIRSDLSAESDQFVILGFETMTQEEEEDIFEAARIESADEVKEDSIVDSPSEESEPSSASHPSLDTPISVTILQIKVSNLNLIQQSKGFHSKMLMNCSGISLSEFIRMPFSEYQIFINQRVV